MHLKKILFFLFISLSGFSQSDFKILHNKSKVVIPFKFINNLIFIPVVVNGEELTFLLDTGVEQTVLFSLDDQDEVNLFEVEKLKLRGLGSKEPIDSYKSSKNKLEIKSLVDLSHEIYIILDQDFNFSSQVGIPVNGILGYNFFKNHIVEIDYEKKKVYVYNHNNKKMNDRLQNKFYKDKITIEDNKPYYISIIESQGKTVPSKLLIDTGNSDAVWVFTSKSHEINLPERHISDYLGRGFSGNVFGKRGRINSFAFGSKTFDMPLVTFPDSLSIRSVNFVPNRVGSIGSEAISRFTVVFDYLNKTIYTKPNTKINEPFDFNMSGIEVEHAGLEWVKQGFDDRDAIKISTSSSTERIQTNMKIHFELKPVFKISSVRVDSDAERVGLKVGDKIRKINGHQAHGLSIQDINELLKSEEGKVIDIEIERQEKVLKFHFRLKKII